MLQQQALHAALPSLRERRALPMLQRGDVASAIKACSNIWASLPGAGYGQHEQRLDGLVAAYQRNGGVVA